MVYTLMNVITRIVVVTALGCSGCASAPTPVPPPVVPWPTSVADTCPQRKVLLECFRKPDISAAMKGLIEHFQACHNPPADPVLVSLKIETSGGTPTCVQHSPRNNEIAGCVAKAVAHYLVIPNSPKDERCDIKYPVRFE
jgi:hypothetical protein